MISVFCIHILKYSRSHTHCSIQNSEVNNVVLTVLPACSSKFIFRILLLSFTVISNQYIIIDYKASASHAETAAVTSFFRQLVRRAQLHMLRFLCNVYKRAK